MPMRRILLSLVLLLSSLVALKQPVFAQRIYGGYYSKERLANVRKNCQKYPWANKKMETAVARAAVWVARSDETLWKMVPGQKLPRTIDVGYDKFATPKFIGCPVCGKKIFKFGNYPYTVDFVNQPWKITCPSCGHVFPTNDFGKFYSSAIDVHGLFDPALGDTSLLYNTAHPDADEPLHKYGVDNGFGYRQDGRMYKFIGYYTWKYWRYIISGLDALANAFLYTGDRRYAHKAAILLDRLADVYPAMDWAPYARLGWYHSDASTGRGKIEGAIWETATVRQLADAYDKILSGTLQDKQLFAFLKRQSEKYDLPSEKGTRALFIKNVDERILKTAFKAVVSRQIWGNQGMQQLAVARCALALNTNPWTTQWLDWLFDPQDGAITALMFNRFDRDGTSDEGAPGYAFIWGHLIAQLADLLNAYPAYTRHNIIRDFPQFKAVFTAAYRMAALGQAIPNLGDAGSTGLVSNSDVRADFMALGYRFTRDTAIALAAYRANGNSAEGLGYDIYAQQPELMHQEILRIGRQAGPRPIAGCLMSGFGLALLESDETESGVALVGNYGRTIHHAHRDALNFDLFAFGHWLAPDQGYPEFATNIPSRTQWTGSTISHNTVLVNQQPQRPIWGGHSQLFAQLKDFGVFQLDGRAAYKGLEKYTRSMFLVGDGDSGTVNGDAYVVDVFQVEGGQDHLYSFHGPPGTVTTRGLQLTEQPRGTYAGEQVAKGAAAGSFPIGYSFLYRVRKDEHPPARFMVDWQMDRGYRAAVGTDTIHLRMYALTPSADVALANGDPPSNKPGNPDSLQYLLIHRKDSQLNSTFISVFEPYKNAPFIKAVHRIPAANDDQIVLQVDKMDGSVNYLLFNLSPTEADIRLKKKGIRMQGEIGYLQLRQDKLAKAVLLNGTALRYKGWEMQSPGAYTGHIVDFDTTNAANGWILVDAALPVDGRLKGRQIVIETSGKRDANYRIQSVRREGAFSRIICDRTAFISQILGHQASDASGGTDSRYRYDFQKGHPFTIASYAIWPSQ